MDHKNIAMLEALLFTASKPVPINDLIKVTGLSKTKINNCLKLMIKEYQKETHGIELKQYDQQLIFVTKEDFAANIQELHQNKSPNYLSQAALETLAIIAYKQPVTRAEIEEIRGVKVEKTLLTLTKYDLIQELGRKDTIGNPIVYGTTNKFLQHFDLKDLTQLPEIKDDNQKMV